MKRLLIFTLLALIPFLTFAEPNVNPLSGKWFNPFTQQTVKIKQKGHLVKVKGLTYHHNWSTFTPNGREEFQDCDGNVIRIIDRNRILVNNRFERSRKIFIRDGHRKDFCYRGCTHNHNHNYYDNYNDNQGHSNYYNDLGNGSHFGINYEPYYNNNQNSYGFDLETVDGTYVIGNEERRVVIVNTRDGLKAKYKGDNNWVKYLRSSRGSTEFENRNGDKIYAHRDGSLRWRKKNGFISLKLVKISSNTNG